VAIACALADGCARPAPPSGGAPAPTLKTPAASAGTLSPATPGRGGETPQAAASATAHAIARAAAEIDRYRAAAGGDTLNGVRSLDIIGVSQSSAVPGPRSVRIRAVYPNHFQQDEKPGSANRNSLESLITLNGELGWFGGDTRLGGPGLAKDRATSIGAQTIGARQAFANVLAGVMPTWLLDSQRFTFVYAETITAGADRGAVVLSVEGPDGRAGKLVLDPDTHLPRRFITVRRTDFGAAASAVTMTFSDYRRVHGVLVPHAIVRDTDAGVHVTWSLANYTMNAKIDLTVFVQQRGRRGR
jgi:hypothetical protein